MLHNFSFKLTFSLSHMSCTIMVMISDSNGAEQGVFISISIVLSYLVLAPASDG